MKLALVSQVLPPGWSGQAMLIYRLVQDLLPDEYCLISRLYDPTASQNGYTRRLPCRYYRLSSEEWIKRGNRFGLAKQRKKINMLAAIIRSGKQIARIVKDEKCDAIVACTGDVLDLPAAYLASHFTKVAFYPYIFDHYSYREWFDPMAQSLARRLEPILLKGATDVIVPNEILRDEFRKKYGIESTVIHNACDLSEYEDLVPNREDSGEEQVRIVYTGDIYEAHYDAVQNLLTALESLSNLNINLHVYTARPQSELTERGIHGQIIYHEHEAMSAMPKIQQRADVLFLPMAFNSPYPDLVRTSATTKMGEYLAARRPILVHAPADSFVSWYCRQHECGLVVDQSAPAKLAEAIERLLSDSKLRQSLSERAWERAKVDFSISTAQSRFIELLKRKAI